MNVAARRIFGRLYSWPLRYPRGKRGSRRFEGHESLTLLENHLVVSIPEENKGAASLRGFHHPEYQRWLTVLTRNLQAPKGVLPASANAGQSHRTPSLLPCASRSVTPQASAASLSLNLDEVHPFSFPFLFLFILTCDVSMTT